MKSTTRILGALVGLSLLFILSSLKGQEQPSGQANVGRFQIAQGEYVVAVSNGVVEKGVFKIDTATGRTWKYLTGMREGKFYENWEPVQ